MTTTTYLFGNQEPSAPFFCNKCQKWYRTVQWGVSCCAYHADGHCHYNDRECPAPDWDGPLARAVSDA